MTMAYTIPQHVLATHLALQSTLESLEGRANREVVLKAVRALYGKDDLSSVEGKVVHTAKALILAEPIQPMSFEPVRKPSDRRTFELMALAWITWATGGDPRRLLSSIIKPTQYGGAIHLMALEPWGGAIQALADGSREEALRLFRRAIELGDQYGTETNAVVQWSYGASFF